MIAENLLTIVEFNTTQLLRKVLAAISVRKVWQRSYYYVIPRDDHFKEDGFKSSMISALSSSHPGAVADLFGRFLTPSRCKKIF